MQNWVIQENNFRGNIKLSSQSRHSFYRYSLWRAQTGEHLLTEQRVTGSRLWTRCGRTCATWLQEKDSRPRSSSIL